MTKKTIIKIIHHIQENLGTCECEYCMKEELGTYLEGLADAVNKKKFKLGE